MDENDLIFALSFGATARGSHLEMGIIATLIEQSFEQLVVRSSALRMKRSPSPDGVPCYEDEINLWIKKPKGYSARPNGFHPGGEHWISAEEAAIKNKSKKGCPPIRRGGEGHPFKKKYSFFI